MTGSQSINMGCYGVYGQSGGIWAMRLALDYHRLGLNIVMESLRLLRSVQGAVMEAQVGQGSIFDVYA